jgi:Glucodextranase, domain B
MQLRALAYVIAMSVVASCGDNRHLGGGDDGPGAAAKIVTTVTPNPVTAGETATATCIVYDADDNVLEGYSPTFEVSPVVDTTTISALTAVVTKVGHYAGQCTIPGLAGNNAGFDVVHALPAQIMIAKVPDQQVYGIGVPVMITHAVADRYGNPIDDAMVINTSTPVVGIGPITLQGTDAFMYGSEGKYHVHALVMPPTDQGADVVADLDLIVNQTGPKITCGSPVDGSMINLAVNSPVTFTGTAVDTNGTMAVTVNGNPVTVDANGAFTAALTSRFGINFVDVKATDDYGVDTVKVCTFLAASQWAGFNTPYSDTVSLRLGQAAIDDGNRSGPINSLGDMLDTVANSPGLHTALDSALNATNPLVPNTCRTQICLPFVGCTCVFRYEVDYQSCALPGPNLDTLALVAGGVTVSERIEDPAINLHVFGQISGIPYDTAGPVNFDYITVTATFNVALISGVPHMSVRAGSVSVTVGSISTNFNGVDGWIIDNIIVPLAQTTLKSSVSGLVQGYITNNFNAVLDGVIGGLDISSLGTSFAVPRLDSGTVTLGFAPSFTSLDTSSQRMLFGIGTNMTAAAANLYTTLGAAVPAGAVLTDPNSNGQATAVAAHIAILDQALHALWKANYFHATVDASLFGGNPGATIDLDARLPPVAEFNNGTVSLALGDLDLTINADTTIPLTVGVRAHTDVTLVGNTLSFTGIVLDELHVSSDVIDLTAMQQASLQMMINMLVQQVIDTSLNNALPSLPIPSFTLPASLAAYGLPVGAQLGITNPTLVITPPHFVLRGGFGIQ